MKLNVNRWRKIKSNKLINIGDRKELGLLIFFGLLIFTIFFKLFRLQVVQADYYNNKLVSLHYTKALLKAKRGNIYVTDKSNKEIQLTKNIELYNIFVDPKFIKDKEKLIELITPVIYRHFCEKFGLVEPTKLECITNIEKFTKAQILPDEKKYFYVSGSDSMVFLDDEQIDQKKQETIDAFDVENAYKLIKTALGEKIISGKRQSNYFGYFDNKILLKNLEELDKDYIYLQGNYVYFIPSKVSNIKTSSALIYDVFKSNGYNFSKESIQDLLEYQDIRYIKLVGGLSSELAKDMKTLKSEYYNDKIDGIPLLHGLGLEKYEQRLYPYSSFMAHILGFIDNNGDSYYGIENYYDEVLRGKDGKMIGLSVPWIGTIGSNSVNIEDSKDGSDIYLTIDPTLQTEMEKLLQFYYKELKADSLSLIVMDPYNGKIKSMANYPTFDPNNYDEIYKVRPLKYGDRNIIDDDTYIDIPVMISDDDKLRNATYEERKDSSLKKYIYKNLLGYQVFLDKNISSPSAPGSVYKTITLGIGLDSDEIGLFDFYEDKGYADVGPYKIKNIHKECLGTNNYLNALERSCNVGMVKIAQKIGRFVYYSYLEKLGFGQKTGIELAGEESGEISALQQYSRARFFNNAFGEGILVTPLQVAIGYSALVNGGYLVKPTIIEKIYDKNTDQEISKDVQIIKRVFKDKTSQDIKYSLFSVLDKGDLDSLAIDGYTLGGKTGTSQIVFKGKYQQGAGWTNGSFVGIVTKENLKYVIAIQVRRPRTCQWGICSAGKMFTDVAKYLIEYDGIEK